MLCASVPLLLCLSLEHVLCLLFKLELLLPLLREGAVSMSKMMSCISLWVSDATLEVFFLPYSARMRSVFECRSKTRTFMNEKGLAIEDTENVKFNKL